jgi:hypothetical protein
MDFARVKTQMGQVRHMNKDLVECRRKVRVGQR